MRDGSYRHLTVWVAKAQTMCSEYLLSSWYKNMSFVCAVKIPIWKWEHMWCFNFLWSIYTINRWMQFTGFKSDGNSNMTQANVLSSFFMPLLSILYILKLRIRKKNFTGNAHWLATCDWQNTTCDIEFHNVTMAMFKTHISKPLKGTL